MEEDVVEVELELDKTVTVETSPAVVAFPGVVIGDVAEVLVVEVVLEVLLEGVLEVELEVEELLVELELVVELQMIDP